MYEQYYTEKAIGEHLVLMLPSIKFNKCIELSAGEGALLEPIVSRWPNIDIVTCELDPKNVKILRDRFEGIHYNIDVLNEDFEQIFSAHQNSFDLVVSNPPYCWKGPTAYDGKILQHFGLTDVFQHSRLRAEVLFILQNLRLLKNDGYAAFILPELIICSILFKKFRQHLISICGIAALTEIKAGGFKGTEARTYILVIRNRTSHAAFKYSNSDGQTIECSIQQFANGLRSQDTAAKNLSELVEIKRGNMSGKECKNSGNNYYHTSGFNKTEKDIRFNKESFPANPVIALPGDLLISRVGTRVLGDIRISTESEYIVSDCVFRVRLANRTLNDDFFHFWSIEKENLIKNARGTCAKYLTKNDILTKFSEFFETLNNQKLIKTAE